MQEAEYIEYLKQFIFRCIISIDFVEEISKVPKDFNVAVKRLTNEERKHLEEYRFYELTQDVHNHPSFKSFVKKLLEVKAEACQDLKEAKRMCETWNKK